MCNLPVIGSDLKPVGRGVCGACQGEATDGKEYIIKNSTLSPKLCNVVINEIVSAHIAARMGLPVQSYTLLRDENGSYSFGSLSLQEGSYHLEPEHALFEQCYNYSDFYKLVVFDIWLCNTDRHEGNLMIRCTGNKGKLDKKTKCTWDKHSVVVIDHSHCLLPDNCSSSYFDSLHKQNSIREYIQLPFVNRAICDIQQLQSAIRTAHDINDDMVYSIIDNVPRELLPQEDHANWIYFLNSRRNRLLELINAGRTFFPNLPAGEI